MTTKKLFELLLLLGGVKSTNWSTVMDLVKCIESEPVDIVKKQWDDILKEEHLDWYPLNLSEIKTWSTYDSTGDEYHSCIYLLFQNKDGKLHCHARIHDGDNMHGTRGNLRFTAEIILPNSFIKKLEERINWAFESYLEDAYENHLEAQKKEWIFNLKSEIIKGKNKK